MVDSMRYDRTILRGWKQKNAQFLSPKYVLPRRLGILLLAGGEPSRRLQDKIGSFPATIQCHSRIVSHSFVRKITREERLFSYTTKKEEKQAKTRSICEVGSCEAYMR